jgi:hypothetical protein
MTKLAAAEFIRELPEFESPVAQAAIDEAIGKRESKPKVERKAQAKKPVVKKPAKPKNMKERAQQLLGLTDEEMAKTPKSILDELENAPF